jgi:hypothetical protein
MTSNFTRDFALLVMIRAKFESLSIVMNVILSVFLIDVQQVLLLTSMFLFLFLFLSIRCLSIHRKTIFDAKTVLIVFDVQNWEKRADVVEMWLVIIARIKKTSAFS